MEIGMYVSFGHLRLSGVGQAKVNGPRRTVARARSVESLAYDQAVDLRRPLCKVQTHQAQWLKSNVNKF
jgi:hypothetical protein